MGTLFTEFFKIEKLHKIVLNLIKYLSPNLQIDF